MAPLLEPLLDLIQLFSNETLSIIVLLHYIGCNPRILNFQQTSCPSIITQLMPQGALFSKFMDFMSTKKKQVQQMLICYKDITLYTISLKWFSYQVNFTYCKVLNCITVFVFRKIPPDICMQWKINFCCLLLHNLILFIVCKAQVKVISFQSYSLTQASSFDVIDTSPSSMASSQSLLYFLLPCTC